MNSPLKASSWCVTLTCIFRKFWDLPCLFLLPRIFWPACGICHTKYRDHRIVVSWHRADLFTNHETTIMTFMFITYSMGQTCISLRIQARKRLSSHFFFLFMCQLSVFSLFFFASFFVFFSFFFGFLDVTQKKKKAGQPVSTLHFSDLYSSSYWIHKRTFQTWELRHNFNTLLQYSNDPRYA